MARNRVNTVEEEKLQPDCKENPFTVLLGDKNHYSSKKKCMA